MVNVFTQVHVLDRFLESEACWWFDVVSDSRTVSMRKNRLIIRPLLSAEIGQPFVINHSKVISNKQTEWFAFETAMAS